MNFILSTLTAVTTMMSSLLFTNEFTQLTVIYFTVFAISYCWFWERVLEEVGKYKIKIIKKTASKG